MGFTSEQVAHYYDSNTESFLRWGQGGAVGALHRAVWGAGVEDRAAALHFVHGLLLEEISALGVLPLRVLDLGCGTGATLRYLAQRMPLYCTGVGNSSVQIELGRTALESTPLPSGRRPIELRHGDFCSAPLGGPHDLAFAIESFVQAPDADTFFRQAAASLRGHGRLVVCDDFLTPRGASIRLSHKERRRLDDFRRGWRLSSLDTIERADESAARAGFRVVRDIDLTSDVEIDRPRDRWIRILVSLGRGLSAKHPRWLTLVGGDALQRCLASDLVTYRFRVWDRLDDREPWSGVERRRRERL